MSLQRTYLRAGEPVEVKAERVGGDHWRVRVGNLDYEFRATARSDGGIRLVPVGGYAKAACVAYGARAGQAFMVRVAGSTHLLSAPQPRRKGSLEATGVIRAPMTGTVMRVNCKVGDVVEADQTLAVLTAMKMEHKLCAGLAGIVRKVVASEGANVEQGTILIEVEASKP
ncbi:MAG: hypothetical protein NT107_01570 [Planctomycetota bacterium]|nr:hypothetical protein [Planctomycetota bacterium]